MRVREHAGDDPQLFYMCGQQISACPVATSPAACCLHNTGVLQVEAMAQLGGIVMLDPEGPSKEQFFFGGIEKCRFKKPVVPGDTLVSPLGSQKTIKRSGCASLS